VDDPSPTPYTKLNKSAGHQNAGVDGTRPDRPSPRAVPPSFGPRTRCRVGRCSIRDRRRFSLQTCSLSSSSLLDEGHAAGRAPGVQDLCVARLDDLHRLSRAHTHRGRGRACERAGAERGSSRRKRVSGAWREGLAEGACACACAATHILGGRLGESLLAHGLLEHLELRLGHGRSCACIARGRVSTNARTSGDGFAAATARPRTRSPALRKTGSVPGCCRLWALRPRRAGPGVPVSPPTPQSGAVHYPRGHTTQHPRRGASPACTEPRPARIYPSPPPAYARHRVSPTAGGDLEQPSETHGGCERPPRSWVRLRAAAQQSGESRASGGT